ncbi:hypothetical protein [Morganella morganii]|uniref:hypothetical protein n=1 Tax=Morganella morganii TaxID=582 RepID=UPI0032DAF971
MTLSNTQGNFLPNDPKWRTISRISKQPIHLVLATYIHLLMTTDTHGYVSIVPEDLASALDVEDDQISAVLDAMQGRVLNGEKISGWELLPEVI